MNKLKYLILIICVFVLCGCDATYEVSIKDEKVSDKLIINNVEITDAEAQIYTTNSIPIDRNLPSFLENDTETLPNQYPVNSDGSDYKIRYKNNKFQISSNNVSIGNYNNSRIANSLFNQMYVMEYENFIIIKGYDGLKAFLTYPELEEVTIKIKVDREVIESNASEVENNTYIWHFDKNSNEDDILYLEYDTEKVEQEKKEAAESRFSWILVGIFLGVFALIILGILLVVFIKNRANNKI